jgi:hypothetical protein
MTRPASNASAPPPSPSETRVAGKRRRRVPPSLQAFHKTRKRSNLGLFPRSRAAMRRLPAWTARPGKPRARVNSVYPRARRPYPRRVRHNPSFQRGRDLRGRFAARLPALPLGGALRRGKDTRLCPRALARTCVVFQNEGDASSRRSGEPCERACSSARGI